MIEPGLGGLERLEPVTTERAPRMRDPRLDLALSVRVPDTTRQCDDAIVREHVAVYSGLIGGS